MIRFIDLGEQIGETDEGVKEFAFYDTVECKFLNIDGTQKWTCKEEFHDDYRSKNSFRGIDRYINLIPEAWNSGSDESDNATVLMVKSIERQLMNEINRLKEFTGLDN